MSTCSPPGKFVARSAVCGVAPQQAPQKCTAVDRPPSKGETLTKRAWQVPQLGRRTLPAGLSDFMMFRAIGQVTRKVGYRRARVRGAVGQSLSSVQWKQQMRSRRARKAPTSGARATPFRKSDSGRWIYAPIAGSSRTRTGSFEYVPRLSRNWTPAPKRNMRLRGGN